MTREVLAALCPTCDLQLPAEFLTCPHDNVIDVANLGEQPGRGICNDCGTSAWFGPRPGHPGPDPAPRLIMPPAGKLTSDQVAAFEARFAAVQRLPHRTVFVPTVASITAVSRAELNGR